jgi:hypothetical protein
MAEKSSRAEIYHSRADEVRTIVRTMKDGQIKRLLLKLAANMSKWLGTLLPKDK